MGTFLHQPRLCADELLGVLRARLLPARPQRATTAAGIDVIGVAVTRDGARRAWDEWRGRYGETGWWPYVTQRSPEAVAAASRYTGVDAEALAERMAGVVAQDHDARAASVVVSGFRWSTDCTGGGEQDLEDWRDDWDPDRLALRLGPALADPLPGASRWVSRAWGGWGGPRWLNFVPVRGGHELPVVLPHLIGANGHGHGDRVLTPADDAALLRRWREQWGAEVFLADGPHLELVVDRPPLDPRGAAQAATELLGYCSDTVQDPCGVGDGMARSTMWSLWWD
ncbi:DUF4253 domain-containing protein [Streptomyces sp. NPDC093225]|uniref:DUF4253 domain-containing protein n=1 Tax=Streptomyces sp. NPDC093225 TaxID=3366034 RepID=UPI0037FAC17A